MHISDLSCTDLIFLSKVDCYADSEDLNIAWATSIQYYKQSKGFEIDLATTLGQASQTNTSQKVSTDIGELHFFMVACCNQCGFPSMDPVSYLELLWALDFLPSSIFSRDSTGETYGISDTKWPVTHCLLYQV